MNESDFVEEVDHAPRTSPWKFKEHVPDTSRSLDVATDVKEEQHRARTGSRATRPSDTVASFSR